MPDKAEPAVAVAQRLFKMPENEVKRLMEPLDYLLHSLNNNQHQHEQQEQADDGCGASAAGTRSLSSFIEEFD